MQRIVGNVSLARKHTPQKVSMLPAITGKRSSSGVFGQGIGDLALRAQRQYPSGMLTATHRRAHAARAPSVALAISSKDQTQNVSFVP